MSTCPLASRQSYPGNRRLKDVEAINVRKSRFIYDMIRRLCFLTLTIAVLLAACTDNDSFSTAPGNRLTFSTDTVKFDTLFSTVPSVTETFWVHNESSDGIRIQSVRLERTTQSGYRVNVDGTYLDPVGTDFEVRKGDSILVFVEVTTHETHAKEPQLVEDNLLFTLENGAQQKVNLRTYSWDALKLTDLVVSRDTTIESDKPVVVYGSGIRVDSAATLTLRNTTLYFHDGAGMDVCGQLVAENCVFRGDRLDHMFDYLPYDRISGQWRGISITSSSSYNILNNCEIRNAWDALDCDSTAIQMVGTIVHNNRGVGLSARNSQVALSYCQFTNTLGDCLALKGCEAVVDHCTLGQFYPFSADRGLALYFHRPQSLHCEGSIVTGYAENVVSEISPEDSGKLLFTNSLLRSAKKDTTNVEAYKDIRWESPEDSVQGTKHFVKIDENNFVYDFHLDSLSTAKGLGCY